MARIDVEPHHCLFDCRRDGDFVVFSFQAKFFIAIRFTSLNSIGFMDVLCGIHLKVQVQRILPHEIRFKIKLLKKRVHQCIGEGSCVVACNGRHFAPTNHRCVGMVTWALASQHVGDDSLHGCHQLSALPVEKSIRSFEAKVAHVNEDLHRMMSGHKTFQLISLPGLRWSRIFHHIVSTFSNLKLSNLDGKTNEGQSILGLSSRLSPKPDSRIEEVTKVRMEKPT